MIELYSEDLRQNNVNSARAKLRYNAESYISATLTLLLCLPMSKVALPGLTRGSSTSQDTKANMSLPANKNPFISVGDWTPELLSQIEVKVGDPVETTSDFTRKRNPTFRYWKASVEFKYKEFKSRIIKMNGVDVPYVKATNYGQDFIYARLQKSVGNAIVAAGLPKDLKITTADKRVSSGAEEMWMTINGTAGRIGLVDASGNFDSKDVVAVFNKTQNGIKVNLDVVFNIRLQLVERDRTARDVFTISADCSRASIKAGNVEVEPPAVDGTVPQQQASRNDIASQELIDMFDNLLV